MIISLQLYGINHSNPIQIIFLNTSIWPLNETNKYTHPLRIKVGMAVMAMKALVNK